MDKGKILTRILVSGTAFFAAIGVLGLANELYAGKIYNHPLQDQAGFSIEGTIHGNRYTYSIEPVPIAYGSTVQERLIVDDTTYIDYNNDNWPDIVKVGRKTIYWNVFGQSFQPLKQNIDPEPLRNAGHDLLEQLSK